MAEEQQKPPVPMPVNEPGEYLDAPDLLYADEGAPEEVKAELERRARARRQPKPCSSTADMRREPPTEAQA